MPTERPGALALKALSEMGLDFLSRILNTLHSRDIGRLSQVSAEINIGVQAALKAALPTYSTFFDGSKMGLERGPFTTNEPLLMLRFCAQPAPMMGIVQ